MPRRSVARVEATSGEPPRGARLDGQLASRPREDPDVHVGWRRTRYAGTPITPRLRVGDRVHRRADDLGHRLPPASAAPSTTPVGRGFGKLETLSELQPARLVLSTGNVYWTTNVDPVSGVGYARIYRMSKAGEPGTERLIYQEESDGSTYFFDLTYAKIGTQYFAYFVVNKADERTSAIKRVSLGGGAARTIATAPGYVGARELVTDGTYLFWADEGGLRRVSISGGPVTTLSTAPDQGELALTGSRVYFSSAKRIRSVAKLGGDERQELTTGSYINGLFARSGFLGTSLYWAETDGSVRGRSSFGLRTTYQNSFEEDLGSASSVHAYQRWVAWTDCKPSEEGPTVCRAHVRTGNTTVAPRAGSFPVDVQTDGSAMFWGDSLGLRKFS